MIKMLKLMEMLNNVTANREMLHDLVDAVCDVFDKYKNKSTESKEIVESVENEVKELVSKSAIQEYKPVQKCKIKELSFYKYSTSNKFDFRIKEDYDKLILAIEDIISEHKTLCSSDFAYILCTKLGRIIPYNCIKLIFKSIKKDYNYKLIVKTGKRGHIDFESRANFACLVLNGMGCNAASVLSKYLTGNYTWIDDIPSDMLTNERLYNIYINNKELIDDYCKRHPGKFKIPTKPEDTPIGPLSDVYEPKKEEPEPVEMHLNEYSVLVPWPGMKPNKKNTIVPEKKQSESKMIMKEDAPKRKRSKKFTLDMITRDLVEKMVGTYCNRRDKYYFKDNFAVKDAMKADGIPHMQSWIANAIIFGHKYLDEDFKSIQTPGYVLSRCPTAETDIKYISKIRWLRNHGKTLNEVLDIMKGENRDNVSKVYYEGIYPGFCQVSIEDERAYNYKYFGITPN